MTNKKHPVKHLSKQQINAYAQAHCCDQIAKNTAAYQANKPAKQADKSVFLKAAAKRIKRKNNVVKFKKPVAAHKTVKRKVTFVKGRSVHFAQSVITANKQRTTLKLPAFTDQEAKTYYKTYMRNLAKAALAAHIVLKKAKQQPETLLKAA